MAVLYKLALHGTDHLYLVSVIDCHDIGLDLAAPQSEPGRKALELFLIDLSGGTAAQHPGVVSNGMS